MFTRADWWFSVTRTKLFVSVETSRVARRWSFGCFYSKEEEKRLDRDCPPDHTLAANSGVLLMKPINREIQHQRFVRTWYFTHRAFNH